MRGGAVHSTRYWHWTVVGLAAAVVLVVTSAYAQESPVACTLLQPAELASALGGKAGELSGTSTGSAEICNGQVGTFKVMIRTAKRTRDDDGAVERKGIEVARKMGMLVEGKIDGDMTCSTLVPPPALAEMGFNTTCSILRAGSVVAVEVTAPSQKEMASMEVVGQLVQKAITRF